MPELRPAESVRIGPEADGGENLDVLSPNIGRQILDLGLIDEIDLRPVMLGQGAGLYDNAGSEPINLHHVGQRDPIATVNVRCRATTTAKVPTRTEPGN